ncbi:potassium channel family protein [Methanosarcina sp. KYL-1]|uniref:potassium channel family protein n=1 Tax=Methanosarcina sp. KYL-1 TaxID=2602068 RepID=UPI002100D20A|nr:potassium channel family protein [Methanosarcina sp. KYL-1]
MKKQLENEEFQTLLFLVIMILLLGTFFYHNVEGWGWLDSLYFSVITLTTIGYGDFSPKTDLGKAFTMIYVFAGLGILYGFATILGKEIVTHRLEKVGKTKQDNEDSEE